MNFKIPDWLKYELIDRARKIRDYANRNPKVIMVISLSSVFILLLIIISMLGGESRPVEEPTKKAWFYDLNTGELFADKADKQPPIDAPSGPTPEGMKAGVKANVFTYVNNPADSDLIIGYLEKPDPNAVDSPLGGNQMAIDGVGRFGRGLLIRTIADANWYPADSSMGRRIITQATKRDKTGKLAKYHTP